jgi:hypothetical protein
VKPKLPAYFATLPKADLSSSASRPSARRPAAPPTTAPGPATARGRASSTSTCWIRAATPTFEIEGTAYHEGLPGHHMQISIAQELTGLPKFRTPAAATAPMSRAGASIRRGSPRRWASTPTPTATSAGWAATSGAASAWWSTPASTPRAGARSQAYQFYAATRRSRRQDPLGDPPLLRHPRPGLLLQGRPWCASRPARQEARPRWADRFDLCAASTTPCCASRRHAVADPGDPREALGRGAQDGLAGPREGQAQRLPLPAHPRLISRNAASRATS